MTHVSMILKVYKTQMMYENHEICKYLTISHSGYGKKIEYVMYIAYKSNIFEEVSRN
jgi:hypothetical protein